MNENNAKERDLLGDQIGWAVRELTPPTQELRKLDQKIMRSLPRSIARAVALIRLEKGWLPDKGNPLDTYKELAIQLVGSYLEEFGKTHQFTHIQFPFLINSPLQVELPNIPEGLTKRSVQWIKQLEWAQKIQTRQEAGEGVRIDDLKEAVSIVTIQNELTHFFQVLKPKFVKRGLPFPWVPPSNYSSSTPKR